jgi:DHA2 family multidrug resistance protein-like MFS transporter
MTTNTLEIKAGRREWLGLASLAMPTLLLSVDTSVIYLALPHLSADLSASSTQQLWIMDIYGFMIAGFLITMGTLGDRIGRRKLLLIGAAAFGSASVLAAFSTTAGTLIAARALMGIAGATLMPSTLALISNMFLNPRQRATAISLWMTCFLVGMIVGPLIGGIMLEKFWWGSVFLLGAPVMLLLLILGPVVLPEYRNPQAGKLDLLDVLLSLAAILPFIYGFTEIAREGWKLLSVISILTGIIFSIVFVYRQLRLEHPLLDLRLFSNRAFSVTLTTMLLTAVMMGAMGFLITQYLQTVVGLSPLKAGLWMVPQSIGMILGTMLGPPIAQRIGPAYTIAGGLVITIIGMLLIYLAPAVDGLLILVTGFVLDTIGIAPTVVLGTDLVVGSAPPEKAGSAASLSETCNQLGIALGVAALGSIASVVYRSRLISVSIPEARESIIGALAVAGKLPGKEGTSLMADAREAFTSGVHVVALTAAAVFALLAVLAFTTLGKKRAG